MPKDFPRARRVAEQIQRELADLIRLELKDPRVGLMVTLTEVEVTQDMSHAKVFFTVMGDAAQIQEIQRALQHTAGFLRSQLSRRMKLRTMPQLHFQYDESVERGLRLDSLIDQAVAQDRQRSGNAED